MAFISEDEFNYDSTVKKIKFIDEFYGSDQAINVSEGIGRSKGGRRKENSVSLYGKKYERIFRDMDRLEVLYEKELNESDEVVARMKNSPKNVKYEMEARTIRLGILKNMMDLNKQRGDFTLKMKKAEDDSIKLSLDIAKAQGTLGSGLGAGLSDTVVNPESYILDKMENNAFTSAENLIQIPQGTVVNPTIPTSFPRMVETRQRPMELKRVEDIAKPIEETKLEEPVIKKSILQSSDTIVNALGEVVEVRDDIDNDFDEGATMASGKLSLENILIKKNENIKEFFKYNPTEKMGYFTYYDESKGEEIKKGTHIPLGISFPLNIDIHHGVVSTRLDENYPIIMTDEPMPIEVKEEWEKLNKIVEERDKATLG